MSQLTQWQIWQRLSQALHFYMLQVYVLIEELEQVHGLRCQHVLIGSFGSRWHTMIHDHMEVALQPQILLQWGEDPSWILFIEQRQGVCIIKAVPSRALRPLPRSSPPVHLTSQTSEGGGR